MAFRADICRCRHTFVGWELFVEKQLRTRRSSNDEKYQAIARLNMNREQNASKNQKKKNKMKKKTANGKYEKSRNEWWVNNAHKR